MEIWIPDRSGIQGVSNCQMVQILNSTKIFLFSKGIWIQDWNSDIFFLSHKQKRLKSGPVAELHLPKHMPLPLEYQTVKNLDF